MYDRSCVLCPVLRPNGEPRYAERPPADDGCRYGLDRTLADLPDLHSRLARPEQGPYDDSWYAVVDNRGRLTGDRRRRDPLGAVGGAGPTPGRRDAPMVSGTQERSTPANLDAVDLTGPSRPATVRDTLVPAVILHPVEVVLRQTVMTCTGPTVREKRERRWERRPLFDAAGRPVLVAAGDQVGHASVTTVLDSWVRDVRLQLWPASPLPKGHVSALVWWLRDRLEAVIDYFSPIVDLAREVRDLHGGLRRALGEGRPAPVVMWGAPCRRCNAVSQILLRPDGYRECSGEYGCGLMYSESEWRDHLASEQVRRLLPGG